MSRFVELLLIVVFSPIWIPATVLTGLISAIVQGRPVLFRQERAGKGGRPFLMVKFRTMREGCESDEERLTRFGAFLRKTSLDELPEIWNVLRGEMALVGPRPLPVRYLPRYTAGQNRRHEVRPGITGWAQVNGRNSIDWETKFRLDVEYVDRRSLLFDMRILFLTVVRVLRPKGISHCGTATMPEFFGIISPNEHDKRE